MLLHKITAPGGEIFRAEYQSLDDAQLFMKTVSPPGRLPDSMNWVHMIGTAQVSGSVALLLAAETISYRLGLCSNQLGLQVLFSHC